MQIQSSRNGLNFIPGELTGSWAQNRLRVRDRTKRGISDTRRGDMRWDVSDMRCHLTGSANTKARAVLEKITSDRYKSLAQPHTARHSFQQPDEGNIKPWGLEVVTWRSSHFSSDWDSRTHRELTETFACPCLYSIRLTEQCERGIREGKLQFLRKEEE